MEITSTDKLLVLKGKIDAAKLELAGLQGRQHETMRRLKDEFGVNSLQEARTKLVKLQSELDALDTEIEKGVADLEKEMNLAEGL